MIKKIRQKKSLGILTSSTTKTASIPLSPPIEVRHPRKKKKTNIFVWQKQKIQNKTPDFHVQSSTPHHAHLAQIPSFSSSTSSLSSSSSLSLWSLDHAAVENLLSHALSLSFSILKPKTFSVSISRRRGASTLCIRGPSGRKARSSWRFACRCS